jgi:hypothetical protein
MKHILTFLIQSVVMLVIYPVTFIIGSWDLKFTTLKEFHSLYMKSYKVFINKISGKRVYVLHQRF